MNNRKFEKMILNCFLHDKSRIVYLTQKIKEIENTNKELKQNHLDEIFDMYCEIDIIKTSNKEKLNQTREKTQLEWDARKESRKLKLLYKGMEENTYTNKKRRI